MTDIEIRTQYNLIKEKWSNYLEDKGVKLPELTNKQGKYTKDALALIYLSKNYPNTQYISKQELTNFIKNFYPNTNDVQQGRHLGPQKGFYIISGTRGDAGRIPSGTYKLITLEKPYPNFNPDRHKGFAGDFEEIKAKYNYHCACCGSKEREHHLIEKNVIVELQQGHMDPSKELVEGNIIPQCQICNRPDRNRWIYDNKGRVIEIAQTPDGIRKVKDFLKNASSETINEILQYISKSLK